jgi:photosystem II stability/assembly factor-like uncharacterized protein
LVIDPKKPNTLYVSCRNRQSSSQGIYKSTDGGASFTLVHMNAANDLVIDPVNPSNLYACGFEVMKSADGGATWLDIGTVGYFRLCLAIDPKTPSTLYMGSRAGGVHKSTDSGLTWAPSNAGMENPAVYSLAVDPVEPSTVYAGTSEDTAVGRGRLYKSTDGGASWVELNGGLPEIPISDITIDPQDPKTLYASAFDEIRGPCAGIYKSTDGGASWAEADAGLPMPAACSVAVHPRNSSILYASTFAGIFKSDNGGASWVASNGTIPYGWTYGLAIDPKNPSKRYAATIGGVYKSVDSGATWQFSSDGLQGWGASFITIDSLDPRTLYVAALKQATLVDPTHVFKSTDEGETWTRSSLEDCNIYTIAIDPSHSSTVFAGGTGLYRSEDGGETWTKIEIPIAWVYSIAFDPANSAILYASGIYGIAKSTDRGITWTRIAPEMDNYSYYCIITDPAQPGSVYFAGFRTDFNQGGIFRSTDYGATFEMLGFSDFMVPLSLVIDPVPKPTLYLGNASVSDWGIGGVFSTPLDDISWKEVNRGLVKPCSVTLTLDPERPNTILAAVGGLPERLQAAYGTNTNGPGSGVYSFTYVDVPPPVVKAVKAASSPFRLTLRGSNFHRSARVRINGHLVPKTACKGANSLVAKGGDVLKAMVPIGITVQIKVENDDDGGVSEPFSFTR